MGVQGLFHRMARQASLCAGSSWIFGGSLLAFVLWLVLGPLVHWNELFHLWPTSLLTWLTWILVVLVQHEQVNQEAALQAKLDGLIKAIEAADNRLIGLEKQPPGTRP